MGTNRLIPGQTHSVLLTRVLPEIREGWGWEVHDMGHQKSVIVDTQPYKGSFEWRGFRLCLEI